MRIVFTGGGTGGHLFPLIAVAEAIREFAASHGITPVQLVFMGPKIDNPYWKWLVEQGGIKVVPVAAGKLRRYSSVLNVLDMFKLPFGFLSALVKLFFHMPDVVFSKGGYGSFPVVLASRFYRIPVFIHESDARAGLANRKLAKHASKIFVGFESAKEDFPQNKEVVVSGNPVRKDLTKGDADKGRYVFHLLRKNKPILLVMGGSQGASSINELILNMLDVLLPNFEVVHLTGPERYDKIVSEVEFRLGKLETVGYHPYPFLAEQMPLAYAVADVVISRAGASSIYEIAANAKPSIIVPLEGSAQEHQKANAYAYEASGAAVVLEEFNLSPNLLLSNLEKLLQPDVRERMAKAAKNFIKLDAARLLAQELVGAVYPEKR